LLRIHGAQRKPGEPQHERTYPNDFLRAIPRSASLREVLLLIVPKDCTPRPWAHDAPYPGCILRIHLKPILGLRSRR
jgi:hypothetical protein